jgi:hypothetical protein
MNDSIFLCVYLGIAYTYKTINIIRSQRGVIYYTSKGSIAVRIIVR